jgi:hypothetical protein
MATRALPPPSASPVPPDVRLMNATTGVLALVAAVLLLAMAFLWLARQPLLAIRAISVDGETSRNAGLITMVVGAGITVLGVVVFINSASTDIGQRTGGGGAQPANDAFLRKPTWRSVASGAETTTGAPAAAFPLVFTHRF